MKKDIIRVLAKALENNQDAAMVMLTKAEGSSPRGVGSMMIVDKEGVILAGTIGGGHIEETARKEAADCIRQGRSKTVHYHLNIDAGGPGALNMACGGEVEVFINVLLGNDKILIVGGGHVGFYLYKMAKILNYYVAVLDNRVEYCNRERFPEADELVTGDIASNLAKYPIDEKTNIVILTHGHQYDEEALEKVIDSPARYIGMIGSRKKVALCFQNLRAKGVNEEALGRIYAPIGLNLGGERPEEIALAIMAQIIAVKNGRDRRDISYDS